MGEGSLTQAEIDALLQGADSISAQAPASAGKTAVIQAKGGLTPVEMDLIAELVYQSSLAGIPALGQLLARNVRLFSPYGEVRTSKELEGKIGQGFALVTTILSGKETGVVGFSMNGRDAGRLCSVIMGGNGDEGTDDRLDSAQLATLKDILGPLLQSTIRQISAKTGIQMKPGPVQALVSGGGTPFPFKESPRYFDAQIAVSVDNLLDSSIHFIVSENLASEIYERGKGNIHRHSPELHGDSSSLPGGGKSFKAQEIQADIKEVNFPQFTGGGQGVTSPNNKLLLDVQMTLTVELGRTRMYIKQILGLGEGSIIELDKLAGEPVDLLVNGKLIAKGEVVVIDENFGVRVTDIVSPVDRIKANKRA
jgi:flagellar motor switch protein FliN